MISPRTAWSRTSGTARRVRLPVVYVNPHFGSVSRSRPDRWTVRLVVTASSSPGPKRNGPLAICALKFSSIGAGAPHRHGVIGLAEVARSLEHRPEDRIEIECRATDRREDLAHRGLLREGFLRLVEETRILYRDRGLVGERLEQAQLFRGVRLDPEASRPDGADDLAAAEDRDGRDGVHLVLEIGRAS